MPNDTMTTSASGNGTSSASPERLQEAATGILDQAGRTAESQASKTMDKAGEALDQVARAVRESGNQLRTERPEIANFADTAAQRVEQASSYLREHDPREVVAEAERIARRQPVLVVGGGLLLGLALGRFLRSGAEPSNTQGGQYGATGWSGGTSDQYPTDHAGSSLSSRSAGASSSPSSGYGTGYGASYAPSSTADNLTTTDAVADDMISTGSGASSLKSSSRKATTGTTSTRKTRSSGAE